MLADTRDVCGTPAINASQRIVLVVEDEELVRLSAAEFLRSGDYHVIEAATADEAVSMLSSGVDVDLVFTDIRMPGRMDGLELARWLKANLPAVPVLLTSGYSGTLREGRPMHPLLTKPYSLESLLQKVDEMLQQQQPGSEL